LLFWRCSGPAPHSGACAARAAFTKIGVALSVAILRLRGMTTIVRNPTRSALQLRLPAW
jgi:hypothetical protein